MEDILARLLVADNAVIQQATRDLKEALKNNRSVVELSMIVGKSKNPQLRQYAAVILRQRLRKSGNWMNIDEETKSAIKQDILSNLLSETDHPVKKAILQLIGTIGKHELPRNNWPQLLEFVWTTFSRGGSAHKVLGMFSLSVLSEEFPRLFSSVLPSVTSLVVNILDSELDNTSPLVSYCFDTMKNLATHYSNDQNVKSLYESVMPRVLQAVVCLSDSDENKASEMLNMIDGLVENPTLSTVQHVTVLINMCLVLIRESKYQQVQLKALSVVDTAIKMKKKAIVKQNLLLPVLQTLVHVMQTPSAEDDDDDADVGLDNSEEVNSPFLYAAQVLDGLAINLPPSKLMPPLLEYIQSHATAENPYERKAVFLIMAVVAEGCSEYICNKCFGIFLELVCRGVEEPVAPVRNAALYALGQFSEHLQPEIGKHSEQLMPIFFKYLEYLTNILEKNESEPRNLDRVFYALETFVEHSEKETFLPYLSPLVSKLLSLMMSTSSIHLKELVLSTFGACVTAAEDDISPFFPRIVDCLSGYLTQSLSEDLHCVQALAIDTMATLARAVAPEKFGKVAQDCAQYCTVTLNNRSDPEVQGSVYGLLGAVSIVLKEEMSSIMGPAIGNMIKSIESNEGIVLHFEEEEASTVGGSDELSDVPDEVDLEETDEENDDEEEDMTGYSVENSYLDEKASACYAIKEIAQNTGTEFIPYLETCFNAIFKLLQYPHESIRKAALDSVSQLCVCLSTVPGDEEKFRGAVSVFIPKCAEIIRTDEEREVVSQALESYANLLKSAKSLVLEQLEHREAIFSCVFDIFQKRTLCQVEEEDSSNEDEEDAEQDELLIEYAGDILPYFGRAMSAGAFKTYFGLVFTFLMSKVKPTCTVSQRSFAIGILAECMEPLGPVLHEYYPQIMPEFISGARDENCDIRNNAIYGLGEMLYHGGEQFFLHYGEVLQLLSMCIVQETVPKVIDNICGAVARMIVTNVGLIPLAEVFPVVMACIPLKKDFKENSIIMKCLFHLYEGGHETVVQHLDKILQAAVIIIHHKQGEEDAISMAEHLFACAQHDFPERVAGLRTSFSDDVMPTYTKLMSK